VKKFTIIQKLVSSYAAITFFTLAALMIAYTGLYSLTRTARDIVSYDFAVIDAANRMRESLLAQQSYAAKYAILKDPEFRTLYQQREAEFMEALQKMERTKKDEPFPELVVAYREFRTATDRLFDGGVGDAANLKPAAGKVTALLERTVAEQQKILGNKLIAAKEREQSTIRWTLSLSLSGLLFALGVAALLIFNISSAVRKLKKATHRIAEGDFDFDPGIAPGDEVGDLAEDFTRMARRLKELEQVSLDASPLTRLPGNIAIEQILEKKLNEGKLFAVCYADLDNFKVFNDRYGYIRGSDLIRSTGELIYETVKACGSDNVFIGHVGGDDFVMVVAPDKAAEICEAIIARFDAMIPEFYSPEDRARGETEGTDRYGIHRTFPLMTISIAIIICQKGAYDSATSIGRAAAELKDVLKGETGSTYSINRRGVPR
jgi:diguanylate cyclase (GGDEF)-like protein